MTDYTHLSLDLEGESPLPQLDETPKLNVDDFLKENKLYKEEIVNRFKNDDIDLQELLEMSQEDLRHFVMEDLGVSSRLYVNRFVKAIQTLQEQNTEFEPPSFNNIDPQQIVKIVISKEENDANENMEKKLLEIDNCVKAFETSIEQAKRDYEECNNDIIQYFTQLKDQIIKRKKYLLDENKKLQDLKVSKLNKQLELIEKYKVNLVSKINENDNILHNTNIKKHERKNSIVENSKQMLSDFNLLTTVPDDTSVEFTQTHDPNVSELGDVVSVDTTIDKKYPINSLIMTDEEKQWLHNFIKQKLKKSNYAYNLLLSGTSSSRFKNWHVRCKNKVPTVIVIQSSFDHIFGCYLDGNWLVYEDHKYTNVANAFMFVLRCSDKIQKKYNLKVPVKYDRNKYTKNCGFYAGHNYFYVGGGADLGVFMDDLSREDHWSSFPHSYSEETKKHKKDLIAGGEKFGIKQLEIFSIS